MIDLFEMNLFEMKLFEMKLFHAAFRKGNNNRESYVVLKNQIKKIINLNNDKISHIFKW